MKYFVLQSTSTRFFLFIAFFPQLVAGPIVRASDFLPQLGRKIQLQHGNIVLGFQIFLMGAVQKALIADNLSVFVDRVYSLPEFYSTATLWLAACSYSLQIFCDFSGYSLMAIGIARILGFTLPKNFNMPYVSLSITEFWRRWHISLSTWLRDYLYISLGGNRKGQLRTYANLFITMLLGGLWHGASWNFVIWGAAHGLLLGLHKAWMSFSDRHLGNRITQLREHPIYQAACWAFTFLICTLLWVPFRSPDFATTRTILDGMFSTSHTGFAWYYTPALLLLSLCVCWHLLFKRLGESYNIYFSGSDLLSFRGMTTVGLILLAIVMFVPLHASPFIYFQF